MSPRAPTPASSVANASPAAGVPRGNKVDPIAILWGERAAPLRQAGPARVRLNAQRGSPPGESLAHLFFVFARPAAIHQFQAGAITTPLLAPGRHSQGPATCRRCVHRLAWISHTSVMVTGLKVGGDVEQALEDVGVPSYVLDSTGVVRWLNAAAERLVGDVRGRHFTSVVAPEDSRRARELFSRKVLGTSPATEATGVLVSTAGTRVAVEISAVPLRSGERGSAWGRFHSTCSRATSSGPTSPTDTS